MSDLSDRSDIASDHQDKDNSQDQRGDLNQDKQDQSLLDKNQDIQNEIFALLKGETNNTAQGDRNAIDSGLSDSASNVSVDSDSEQERERTSKKSSRRVPKSGRERNKLAISDDSSDSEYREPKNLKNLTEVEREQLIAEQAERKQKQFEVQEIKTRLNRQGRQPSDSPASEFSDEGTDEEYYVKSRPTRTRKSASSKALRAIKEKKKNKAKRKDYESSDEDSFNEEELRRGFRERTHEIDNSPIVETYKQYAPAILTRDFITNYVHHPWFVKTIIGCFVSVTYGDENNRGYRFAKINDVIEGDSAYDLEGTRTHKVLELQHGKGLKIFPINFISNKPPSDRELYRYNDANKDQGVPPITENHINQMAEKIEAMRTKPQDDDDFEFTIRSNRKSSNDPAVHKSFASFLERLVKECIRAENYEKARLIQEELNVVLLELEPIFEEDRRKMEEAKRIEEEERRQRFIQADRMAQEFFANHRPNVRYDSDDPEGHTRCFKSKKRPEAPVPKKPDPERAPLEYFSELPTDWKQRIKPSVRKIGQEDVMENFLKKIRSN